LNSNGWTYGTPSSPLNPGRSEFPSFDLLLATAHEGAGQALSLRKQGSLSKDEAWEDSEVERASTSDSVLPFGRNNTSSESAVGHGRQQSQERGDQVLQPSIPGDVQGIHLCRSVALLSLTLAELPISINEGYSSIGGFEDMVLDTSPNQSPFEDEVKAGALEDRSIGHYIDSGVTGDSPDAVSNGINSGTQADGETEPGDTIGKDLTIPHAVTDHVVTAPSDLPYQCTDPVVTIACARLASQPPISPDTDSEYRQDTVSRIRELQQKPHQARQDDLSEDELHAPSRYPVVRSSFSCALRRQDRVPSRCLCANRFSWSGI